MEQMNAVNPSERFVGNLNDDNESVQVIRDAHVLPSQKLKHFGSTILRKLKKNKRKSMANNNSTASSIDSDARTFAELEVPVATKVETMPTKVAHIFEHLLLVPAVVQRPIANTPENEGLVFNRIIRAYVTPAENTFINSTQEGYTPEDDETLTRRLRREEIPTVEAYRVLPVRAPTVVEEPEEETERAPVSNRRSSQQPANELDL